MWVLCSLKGWILGSLAPQKLLWVPSAPSTHKVGTYGAMIGTVLIGNTVTTKSTACVDWISETVTVLQYLHM